MEEPSRVSFRDSRLASRKAEEAACRRFVAASWLQSMVGPLGLSSQPSEQEFISCLRSGLVLCNTINKIQPGAVPKVVANQSVGLTGESQPLPAYQYFENIRNFLVAVQELKLPAFEAADIEKETLEVGSVGKIVDCILGLKHYYEWRQSNGGNTPWKHLKSPLVPQSAGRARTKVISSGASARRLDLSSGSKEEKPTQNDKIDFVVRALSDWMFNSKENFDHNVLDSWRNGTADPVKLFSKILSCCLQEKQSKSILKDFFTEGDILMNDSPTVQTHKCCNFCLGKRGCNHFTLIEAQENELHELKALLLHIKGDFVTLQSELHNDLTQLGIQLQGISAAALGYDKAVNENRHLYNMLQELKGNIRVFCRIRPSSTEASSSIDYIGNDGSLMILDPLKPQTRRIFQFNKAFGPTTTQEEIYQDTQSLIRSVMDGYNVCIFAYGQTGSGKTFTMCGPSSGLTKDTGINYMALNDLFQISCTRTDIEYEIRVQMVEIYNEQVRDLLSEDSSTTKLEIRNCSGNGGLSLPDANMHHVQSTSDVLNLMKLGEKNRAFSSTSMNNRSSRSHSILTVHVHGKAVSGSMLRSCLHLVDLAGSERVDKSEVTGDRLKEAQHINKSLACLGDVIMALAQKNSHIPYRNSKLTQLLQSSLGGHAKMLMFAHVSPEADFFGETISTLKFAQRVSTVELGAAHVNRESSEIRDLKEQIDGLTQALTSKEGEKGMSSYKLKENMPASELLKHNTDRTPPRPRRLSIGNAGVTKSGTTANPDERKVLKTPLSRPKFSSEHAPIRLRRLSLEGSKCGKNQQDCEILNSNFHVEDLTGGPLKDNLFVPQLAQDDYTADTKTSLSNDDGSNAVVVTEDLQHFPPSDCNTLCETQMINLESRNDRIPSQQQKKCDLSRQFDELVTPNAKINTKSFNTNASSRGSQIRKSLQTIGKLIHGSERRSNQSPSETSAKFGKTSNTDGKSIITADARARRRESLTNMQPLGLGLTRRSSLGGRSVDSYSTDGQNVRTPPPINRSSKVANRWL